MKKNLFILLLLSFMLLLQQVWASVPPPPANQFIGINDGVFNDLTEEDCRVCHDAAVPDRHHLLYGSEVPDPTDAPFAVPGESFDCLSCHEVIDNGIDPISFIVESDCMVCHIQGSSFELTVHHRTDEALGNLPQGPDCKICHGSLVDNMEDGHFIPTYEPTLRTPKPSGGDGLPLNNEDNGAGGCDYCHSTGTSSSTPGIDDPTGILVYSNEDTHHETGFWGGMGAHGFVCFWCHDDALPLEAKIRVCENCHGPNSLHNIQTDSDGDGLITPGVELPGYGHIGNPNDCWGCHGFSASADLPTQFGSIIPYIHDISASVLTANSEAVLVLDGSAFKNTSGDTEVLSTIRLTPDFGDPIELTPDTISENRMTVTISGTTPIGNYALRAVKIDKISNPIYLSIKPEVVVTAADCDELEGTLSISGHGFGDTPPEGTEEIINVKLGGVPLDITSWIDDSIYASVTSCSGVTTVNALYGSAYSCGCKGNFDNDEDVDGADASLFKFDFGRNDYNNPCATGDLCNGDIDCDEDVDGWDASLFKSDFGRNAYNDPCPPCTVEQWCNYH